MKPYQNSEKPRWATISAQEDSRYIDIAYNAENRAPYQKERIRRSTIMETVYDMIVIGGGPAGYAAALYASRAGLSVAVIEKYGAGGQIALTDTVDNYPGFDEGIDGFTLGMKMKAGAERFGAESISKEVLSVDLTAEIKKIHTSSQVFSARTVVIAAGAAPRELGLPEEKALVGRGVHYCAHCDGRFYKDRTVVVVGGGNSAVSDALYLSGLAKKVYLVHRRDTLRATKLYHDPLLRKKNVEFVWNSAVTSCDIDETFTGVTVKNLKNEETRTIPCDGLFVSIGRKPTTEFLAGTLALDENGYIIADETTQTSIPGVYAAGDIRTKALRQVVTAVSDGAVAAHYAEEYLSKI